MQKPATTAAVWADVLLDSIAILQLILYLLLCTVYTVSHNVIDLLRTKQKEHQIRSSWYQYTNLVPCLCINIVDHKSLVHIQCQGSKR